MQNTKLLFEGSIPNEGSIPLNEGKSSINQDNDTQQTIKKLIYGVLIVIGIAVSWTGSTQFAQSVETQDSFDCPFAVIWFGTSFKTLCVIPVLVNSIGKRDIENINAIAHQNEFQKNIVSPFTIYSALRYIYFYALWTAANYCYVRALYNISATLVTALFSSAPAFVFVFSIFLLEGQNVTLMKLIAVLLCIGGILMIAFNDSDYNFEMIGCILSVFAAICAALYKVSFKKCFGDMDVLNVCQYLSWLGLFNMLFMWTFILILDMTQLEKLPNDNISQWPWFDLIITALLGLAFDFLINFGIAFTYPLFISLGTVVGIPINLVVDMIVHGTSFTTLELFGAFTICIGFVIIVVSDLEINICKNCKRVLS